MTKFLKKAFLLFLLLLSIGLLGCTLNDEPRVEGKELSAPIPVTRQVAEENPTVIPSTMPSPTPTLSLWIDHIRCDNFNEGQEAKSYWVDDLIPGESTIEELHQIIEELPEEQKPIQYGDSSYGNPENEDYYLLIFDEDVLFLKYDPRLYLGDIINYYGEPVQVTWSVRRRSANTGPGVPVEEANTTTLFFPQSNAWFITEGKTTYFSVDTHFIGSVVKPSEFEESYAENNSQISSSEKFVQHFPWPCS